MKDHADRKKRLYISERMGSGCAVDVEHLIQVRGEYVIFVTKVDHHIDVQSTDMSALHAVEDHAKNVINAKKLKRLVFLAY